MQLIDFKQCMPPENTWIHVYDNKNNPEKSCVLKYKKFHGWEVKDNLPFDLKEMTHWKYIDDDFS